MTKVVLFNSPWIAAKIDNVEEGNVHLRMGIASIAAYLRHHSLQVTVIDEFDLDRMKTRIEEIKPDVIGIPAFTFEISDSSKTAEIVKHIVPKALIVVGGPHPSAIPDETLREFPVFDLAVVGEGEQTLLEISQGRNLESISGIAYRHNGKICVTKKRQLLPDLNNLPFPAWDLYDLNKYTLLKKRQGNIWGIFNTGRSKASLYMPIESTRGCPFNCCFCFRISGTSARFKSPKRVVDEMEYSFDQYGAHKFTFVDGTFGINKRISVEICNEIIKRGLENKIQWDVSSRIDVVNEELLTKLKDAGCREVIFGIESGDDQILKKIGKNFTHRRILSVLNLCKKIGLTSHASFILGHPFDTEKTINKTIRFARRLPIATANFAVMVPFPGTKVREMAKNNIVGLRILSNKWDLYGKQIGMAMDLEQIPQRDLIRYQMRAYLKFYSVPWRWKFLISRLTFGRLIYSLKRMFNLIISK